MNKENLSFGQIEIEKYKFHYFKYLINISNVNIDKILISNKVSKKYFKYFICYKDDENVK